MKFSLCLLAINAAPVPSPWWFKHISNDLRKRDAEPEPNIFGQPPKKHEHSGGNHVHKREANIVYFYHPPPPRPPTKHEHYNGNNNHKREADANIASFYHPPPPPPRKHEHYGGNNNHKREAEADPVYRGTAIPYHPPTTKHEGYHGHHNQ